MTDPDSPPTDRPEVVHQPTTKNLPRSGGGSWMGLLVGGLVLVVIIIAVVVFSNRGAIEAPDGADVPVDIDLRRPALPDAPKMPDLPDVPAANPPVMPPEPAPVN